MFAKERCLINLVASPKHNRILTGADGYKSYETVDKLVRGLRRNLNAEGIIKLLDISPGEEESSIVLMCGPDGFVKHARKVLKEDGRIKKVMVW
ncbi:hypothetical protein TL16_g05710 [Triparma laevis f. inornata]|uniref:Uncharacterized protein n=1 Tax=Triparma laevis f. inornata TaxID=1714386 RepID=A0A9W7AG45_9STRA|nr:hypothetical protein TL16_g05710 [Triparma laevis f. inornata]